MVLKQFLGMTCAMGLLLAACETPAAENDSTGAVETPNNKGTLEQRAHREYQAQLEIPVTEKYTLQIYKAHLNADNSEDAIITINRFDLAMDNAAKANNPSKHAEFGYMGNYNYVMYYDGMRDQFSAPIVVPSSARTPLEVGFEHVQSDAFQTTTIEYRIRELGMKSYYFVQNNTFALVFEWKLYDRVGTSDYEANVLELGTEGELTGNKDILIFSGKIKDYTTEIPDMYAYEPVIEKKGGLLYRFFYNPQLGKYVTRKSEANGPLPTLN